MIAIVMLGVAAFMQAQNMGSMNLSISTKNINDQRYLEKLIWAKYIQVPGADDNCTFSAIGVTQIGLSPTKKCIQTGLDSASVLANIYPITCSTTALQFTCKTTKLDEIESNLVKPVMQVLPIFTQDSGPSNTNCQVTADDGGYLTASCTIKNPTSSLALPSYILIFQGNLENPRSDGFIKFYYAPASYQNSSS
jgi:hypothetical protein